MNIFVVEGDIINIYPKVDAIATLINPEGLWYGGVDTAIKRKFGNYYHDQVEMAIPLTDGKVIIAYGQPPVAGNFRDVIFVIDNFGLTLSELVFRTLNAAFLSNYKSVALPLMRTGIALGKVEKSLKDVVIQIDLGLGIFKSFTSLYEMDIYFVVYEGTSTAVLLRSFLTK